MIIKCINFQLVLVETDNDVLFLIFNLTPIIRKKFECNYLEPHKYKNRSFAN